MQVGLVRGQATGAGDGLVEAGVDAPVPRDLGQEAVAVGRAQLLHLPIAQEGIDDRVLTAESLQRGSVGGVAGLRLLLRRQPELVEQHRAQLLGRVDPELHPGQVLDLTVQALDLVGQGPHDRRQVVDIDTDARHLHAGQHAHQGELHLVVEHGQAARRESGAQGGSKPGDRSRPSTGLFGGVRRRPLEVQLAGGWGRR